MIWILLVAIITVWILWVIAAMFQIAIVDTRTPQADGKRRGMSVAPVIPLVPVALWGVAAIVDHFITPWGTIVIGSAHAVFGAALTASIVKDAVILQRIKRSKTTMNENDR